MGKTITVEVELADAQIIWPCLFGACLRIDSESRNLECQLAKFGENDPARVHFIARIAEHQVAYEALYMLFRRMCQSAEAAKKETRRA